MTVDPRYQDGKIYKLINTANDKIYIGSTIQTLTQRMVHHKSLAVGNTTPIYTAMREIGIRNFSIELVRDFPCDSEKDLLAEENKEMLEYPREKLYNSTIDGKASEEAIAKMKAAKAKQIPKTKEEQKIIHDKINTTREKNGPGPNQRGNLTLKTKPNGSQYWEFKWQVKLKRTYKSFYVSTNGGTVALAKEAAIKFQDQMFPPVERKKGNRYHNGKIYRIYNSINDISYIGSTVMSLPAKLSSHKKTATSRNSKFYRGMREIGFDKFKIELVREVKCETEDELLEEEYKEIGTLPSEKLYNVKLEKPGKRGSVWRSATYTFLWEEENKEKKKVKKSKSFAVLKYGEEEAKQMSIEKQNEVFPEGTIAKFGRGSVYKSDAWFFGWKDEKRKRHNKAFRVNIHGEEEAKQKAIKFQNQKFPLEVKGKRKINEVE